MRNNKHFVLISLVLMQIVALSNVNPVSGVLMARLYVDPYLSVETVGNTFNVTIRIEDARDVYGWQIAMSFDPNVLEATNVIIGDFLATQPQGTFSPPSVLNNTQGWVGIGETSLGKNPGVDGSGSLATVTFSVKGDGESFLNITDPVPVTLTHNSTCLLIDSTWPEGKDIPFTTEDGYFLVGAKPVASFTYSPLSPEANELVTFNASTSYDPDGSITKYEWSFGDGSNDTGISVEHTFTAGGTYTVVLNVTDDSPYIFQATSTKHVSIKFGTDIAVTGVTTSSSTVMVGETVSIVVTVTNEGTSVATFGVTIYYDDYVAGTLTFTNLDPDATQSLTYDWDTSQANLDTYRIKAVAASLEGETDTSDNTYVDGTVTVEASGGVGFPLEYVVVGVVALAVVVAVFLYMRRRKP